MPKTLKPLVRCRGMFATAAALTVLMPSIAVSAGEAYQEYISASHYVQVRDGTKLALSIYRPAVDHKAVAAAYPVIFVFTPYRARYRNEKGKVIETGLSPELGLKGLTNHGYVVAVADVRGKGASFGHRRGFQDRTEALDGRDLIEWLAHQPWSTGKVGMLGCSYLGGATLQVASTTPPALKAIFTGASDLDKYAFVRRGGITAQFNTRPDEPPSVDLATLPMDEDPDGAMLKTAVAEHAANTPMAPLWYGMPYRDSVSPLTGNRFWEEVGPYTYLDKIRRAGIATYFWGNWQDEPTQQVIELAANLNGKLLLGPGSHCVPPPSFDLSGEVRRYFDHYLKGIDNGIDRDPRVTMWVVNAPKGQEWHRTNSLPGVGVPRTPFYPDGTRSNSAPSVNDGSLSASATQGSDSFQVDYDVGSADYFAFWVDPMDKHGLTYTTAPLAANKTLAGFPVLHVKAAADQRDVNVFAYLEDVAPDGKAEVVSFGRLAASHRKLSKAPYDTLGLPWHSGRQRDVAPITPGQPVSLALELTPTVRIIPAGHLLRLAIAGADHRQRNLAEIKVDPAPRITIIRGADTHIDLPLVSPDKLP